MVNMGWHCSFYLVPGEGPGHLMALQHTGGPGRCSYLRPGLALSVAKGAQCLVVSMLLPGACQGGSGPALTPERWGCSRDPAPPLLCASAAGAAWPQSSLGQGSHCWRFPLGRHCAEGPEPLLRALTLQQPAQSPSTSWEQTLGPGQAQQPDGAFRRGLGSFWWDIVGHLFDPAPAERPSSVYMGCGTQLYSHLHFSRA